MTTTTTTPSPTFATGRPTLTTPRLTLQMFDPSSTHDLLNLLAAFNDPVSLANAGDPGIKTPAQLHALNLALVIPSTKFTKQVPPPNMAFAGITDGCIPCFNVLLGAENPADSPDGAAGEFMGVVSLVQRGKEAIPDMGWALLSKFHGKGYATEAAREALRYWREECGVVDMIVTTDVKNRGSYHIAEKLGFLKVEGGVKDMKGVSHNLYYAEGGRKPDESWRFSFNGDVGREGEGEVKAEEGKVLPGEVEVGNEEIIVGDEIVPVMA